VIHVDERHRADGTAREEEHRQDDARRGARLGVRVEPKARPQAVHDRVRVELRDLVGRSLADGFGRDGALAERVLLHEHQASGGPRTSDVAHARRELAIDGVDRFLQKLVEARGGVGEIAREKPLARDPVPVTPRVAVALRLGCRGGCVRRFLIGGRGRRRRRGQRCGRERGRCRGLSARRALGRKEQREASEQRAKVREGHGDPSPARSNRRATAFARGDRKLPNRAPLRLPRGRGISAAMGLVRAVFGWIAWLALASAGAVCAGVPGFLAVAVVCVLYYVLLRPRGPVVATPERIAAAREEENMRNSALAAAVFDRAARRGAPAPGSVEGDRRRNPS
jgi:hypothetical protein